MRSEGDWRSIFRWCASILSSYLGIEFRVGSQPRTIGPFQCLELITRFKAVLRVEMDERHVLERNELTEISGGMKIPLNVYNLTNTASLRLLAPEMQGI